MSEFRKFLIQIDREVPKNLTVHLILDSYRAQSSGDKFMRRMP